MSDNPLLSNDPLPDFQSIRPQHVEPAIDTLISEFRQTLDRLAELDQPDWDSFIGREEQLADRIDSAWSPVSHLHSVLDQPEWREVYASNVLKLSGFYTELGQDRRRYKAYQAIHEQPGFEGLEPARRKIVEDALRDFHLSGIDLPEEQRQRYREIRRELTELATRFEEHLQDATDAYSLRFDHAEALAGLPESAIDSARERARDRGEPGYLVTLEMPSYQSVITYADDRALREKLYQAYATRASDQGPHAGQWDNEPIIHRILELRREMGQLLGYRHYADVSLATKMVATPEEALGFLQGLLTRARPKAEQELEDLTRYAREHGGPETLAPWDVAYWSEKLRADRHAISDEEIRPYFSAGDGLHGLFEVAGRLFDIRFRSRDDVSVWHPTVTYYDVLDPDGTVIAGFYVDLYARKGKRGGAWMADCRNRSRSKERLQLPVAFLNCNFPAPTDRCPSLLNHDELSTLFHEFGHTLHHMLTRIDHPSVSGINGVEWDAVELPSQFLEHWCWQSEALSRFARHYETGAPLPDELFERMKAARTFHSGLFLVRQLEFAIADLRLHTEFDPGQPMHARALLDAVRDEVAVMIPPDYNRFLCGFSHLFAGGYGAGYYSYLWADQLAADAFDRFEHEGVFNQDTGLDFRREVLEVGGSRPARESFLAFRGREPQIEPLLRHYGIET